MLVSEEETGGARQLYRVLLPPRRASPPLHYHVSFTETFTAIEGVLDLYLGRERRHVRLHPQESATAELYQPHSFANNSDEPCTMTVESRPAANVVRAFQLAYAVANDGGAANDGLPRDWLMRLRFVSLTGGFLPGLPRTLQQSVLGVAAVLAKVSGTERRIRRYLSAGEG